MQLIGTLHITPVAPSIAFQVNVLILLTLSQFKLLYYTAAYYYEICLKTSAS